MASRCDRLCRRVASGVVSRRPVRPVANEERRALPGDALLPAAKGRWTHAITIQASPAEIWPWLVQMGCRRGGWYSFDGLDNGSAPSAARIQSELQEISVGDLMAGTPRAVEGCFVAAIEPERALVLEGNAGLDRVIWAFVLQPTDARTTRLLVRASGEWGATQRRPDAVPVLAPDALRHAAQAARHPPQASRG